LVSRIFVQQLVVSGFRHRPELLCPALARSSNGTDYYLLVLEIKLYFVVKPCLAQVKLRDSDTL
jgi:hypothetical protein